MTVKETVRHVPLQEFPSLFTMEGHTGLVGAIFSSIWFALVAKYIPTTLTSYWFLAIAISFAFFLLSWTSLALANYFAQKIFEVDGISESTVSLERERIERQVRQLISFLSASYVIVFSVLIWLTGGIASPFVAFYVMIFALTICRIKVTNQIVVVALYFSSAILLSCLAREFWPWPSSRYEAWDIQRTALGSFIHLAFLCASLLAPVVSMYLVSVRATKRLLDDLYRKNI